MTKSGMIVYFDASSSGTQILGLASNCRSSMGATNVMPSYDNDGKVRRRDSYLEIAEEMLDYVILSDTILKTNLKERRKQVKSPCMTVFYGSVQEPKNVFGEGTTDLHAFYEALNTITPGPMALIELMQSLWDPSKDYLEWEIDGVHAKIAILDKFLGTVKMTVNGKKVSVPFQSIIRQPKDKGLSIAANVTHFCDNWIKDYVVKEFKGLGLSITTIHDCFGVHPNDVIFLMDSYRYAMHQFYNKKILRDILRQLSGDPTLEIPQMSPINYSGEILNSRYALS